ncbi:MaoC family dehydratase [Paremcibacter congregatus]|nr:MaoC family dehydratase [Paremcibacter congregatus]QDE26249.1 MaoC family dehydratase [Paremcibacter congregatus]
MTKLKTIDDLINLTDTEIGVSPWVQLTQKKVDQFAQLTEDHQFIHINPAKARAAGFDGTIVHGFFLLSLISKFQFDLMPPIDGVSSILNYGLNKTRFIAPVPVGSRVRGRLSIKAVTERKAGQYLITCETILEIEGLEIERQDKPGFIAEHLGLVIMA